MAGGFGRLRGRTRGSSIEEDDTEGNSSVVDDSEGGKELVEDVDGQVSPLAYGEGGGRRA